MKSDELRNLQAPLKNKYRDNPDSALKTLKVNGKIGEDVTCIIDSKHGLITAGLHPASGGNGKTDCSGDILLEALVACSGVTLGAIATAFGIEIKESEIFAEGDLDFRGTLGVTPGIPVGFKTIRLKYIIKSDAPSEKIKNLINLTEKYCVVYQTLKSGTAMETSIEQNI